MTGRRSDPILALGQLRRLPCSTWVIKYICRNWPKHPCSKHQPVSFIAFARNVLILLFKQFDKDLRYATLRYATLRYATLRYATLRYEWLSSNYFCANPMDLCVVPTLPLSGLIASSVRYPRFRLNRILTNRCPLL